MRALLVILIVLNAICVAYNVSHANKGAILLNLVAIVFLALALGAGGR